MLRQQATRPLTALEAQHQKNKTRGAHTPQSLANPLVKMKNAVCLWLGLCSSGGWRLDSRGSGSLQLLRSNCSMMECVPSRALCDKGEWGPAMHQQHQQHPARAWQGGIQSVACLKTVQRVQA